MQKTKLEQAIAKLRERGDRKALQKIYRKIMDVVYSPDLSKPLKNTIVVNNKVFERTLATWEYAVYITFSMFNLFDSTDDDAEFRTSMISLETLYSVLNIPFSKHRNEYKNKIKQSLESLQQKGLIELEYLTDESQKDARLFVVHQAECIEDERKKYTMLSLESVQKIICNVDKVDTRMKMLQVFLSVHNRMWFSKHDSMNNPVCYENLNAIAERVGLNEEQASKYLKALVDLKALASFNVLRMGKNKNYYSRIESAEELKGHILYQIEKVTYITLDYKSIEKTLKAKNKLHKEDSSVDVDSAEQVEEVIEIEETEQVADEQVEENQLKSVISNDSITVEATEIKHEVTEEMKQQDELKGLKEFADFLKRKQHLVQYGYTSSDLHNMFQREQEDKQERERELVCVGAGDDDYYLSDDDFEDLF
ncbi:hypothetical protein NHG29_09165 [Aerococcaceae bacterium NML160702]|nr:hypothetical protein [Aerococcaceae bacterium NML160702]